MDLVKKAYNNSSLSVISYKNYNGFRKNGAYGNSSLNVISWYSFYKPKLIRVKLI